VGRFVTCKSHMHDRWDRYFLRPTLLASRLPARMMARKNRVGKRDEVAGCDIYIYIYIYIYTRILDEDFTAARGEHAA